MDLCKAIFAHPQEGEWFIWSFNDEAGTVSCLPYQTVGDEGFFIDELKHFPISEVINAKWPPMLLEATKEFVYGVDGHNAHLVCRAKFIDEPGFNELYVRTSYRKLPEHTRIVSTFDLARIEVIAQGEGTLTRYLDALIHHATTNRKEFPYTAIFVENVFNPFLSDFLTCKGFKVFPRLLGDNITPPSFYYLLPE